MRAKEHDSPEFLGYWERKTVGFVARKKDGTAKTRICDKKCFTQQTCAITSFTQDLLQMCVNNTHIH